MFTLRLIIIMMTMTINFQLLTADFNTSDDISSPFEKDSPLDSQQKRFTKSCTQSDGFVVSADYVKFSDFVEFNGRLPNECRTKLVKILATRELIIDRDLTVTDSDLRVTIIAPQWRVSGFREMSLEVEMFLGIAETIVNEENLIMTTSGSKFNKLMQLGSQSEIPYNELLNKYSYSANSGPDLIDKEFDEIRVLRRRKREVGSQTVPYHISYAINAYKTLIREKSSNKFEHKKIMTSYDMLKQLEIRRQYCSALTLVNEFESLENQYFNLKNNPHIDFYSFYQSLLNQISEYAKNPNPNENSIEYKKIYNYLYTAALSKINVLKNNTEPNLIVDISTYIATVIDKFQDLSKFKTEFNNVKTINKQNQEYKEKFKNKIDEAMGFITKEIMPEIDNINGIMNKQMAQLIEENTQRIDKAKDERQAAIEARDKMAKNMIMGQLIGFVKTCTAFASLLGPVGTAVGELAATGTSIAESALIDKSGDGPKELTKIPEGAKDLVNQVDDDMQRDNKQKITDFKKNLAAIDDKLRGIKTEEVELGSMQTIADVKTELKKLEEGNDEDNAKEIITLKEKLDSSLKKDGKELQSKSKNMEDKFDKAAKLVNVVSTLVDASAPIIDFVNQIGEDQQKLDAAGEAVEKAGKNVKLLQKYEDEIYDKLIPMKKEMFGSMNKVTGELEGKSLVALDVKKWQIQSTLKDAKDKLKNFISGFKVEDQVLRSVEKLQDVMTTLVNVYDRIENYQEQKQLADYLKDITSAAAKETKISDPELNTAIQRLEIVIKSNVVINEYDITVNALKQWLFPFADHYLDEYRLPAHIFNYSSATLEDIIKNAADKATYLKGQIEKYKSVIDNHDEYTHTAEFKSNYTSIRPFFVWSNQRFKRELSTLLRGNEISLLADVKSSDEDKDAIKFNRLRFYFKVADADEQRKLDEVLDSFKIIATHSGNSYFRFQGKFYALNSRSLNFEYHFENGPNDEPTDFNWVYDKIKSKDIMLSPYTMWKIKIVQVPVGKSSYTDLLRFQDEVSLELQGRGSYVEKSKEGTADANEWQEYLQ